MQKKLYRVKEGKMLCGVCNGIAEYFELDVSIIRLITIVASCFGGAGLIAYIAAAFVIPEKPSGV
ncbi:MAG: PspC domain-containing protein [Eubacteriales bacterium]|nr:PspC domain-containing protein [Eubacteriales bacterium]MDD4422331.1 PspC domain-containing protein [Eubacteriales bacterium]HBR31855.1 PspC domain-containing protein [Clostridiales bacterium]